MARSLPDNGCALGQSDQEGVEGVSVDELPYIDNTEGRRTGIVWSGVYVIRLSWPTCKCQASLFGHGANAYRIAPDECMKLVFQTYLFSTLLADLGRLAVVNFILSPTQTSFSSWKLGCLAEQWGFYVRTQVPKG